MSKNLKFLGVFVAASLCILAGSAHAETRDEKLDRHFSLLDSDGDGVISRQEAAAHPPLAQHFRGMDKNRDGTISKHELATYRVAPRNRALAKADTAAGGASSSGSTE